MDLQNMARALRFLALDMVARANSGHPGIAMGAAEIVAALHARHLRFDPSNPRAGGRDRFVLSAGHGSALLYAALYLRGDRDISLADLKKFRRLGAKTAGHPEYGSLGGVETTTGPLGQGLATAVGMAIAAKIKGEPHRIYVLAGDGCLMEGVSQEAASLAGTRALDNLVIIWDSNDIVIDGRASAVDATDQLARFAAMGFATFECKKGNDAAAVSAVLKKAGSCGRPAFVAVRTKIGKGYSKVEDTAAVHGKPLSPEQVAEAKKESAYPFAPFEADPRALADWRSTGRPLRAAKPVRIAIKNWAAPVSPAKISTRAASGAVLEKIAPARPDLIGGTADLAGPTCTRPASMAKRNFIEYGVREHAMGAIMNGLALSGLRAYGGTLLTFYDYMKPACRQAALMRLPVIYVFTHDSVYIGEDGPTHQPVEQLAALRATPNMNVIRPCDSAETAAAWRIALGSKDTPTAIILARQDTPNLHGDLAEEPRTGQGAYVISNAPRARITLIASGSEVALALEAKKLLAAKKVAARVVSVPSWFLFEKLPAARRDSIIAKNTLRISIEAASTLGWARYADLQIGLDRFGASGPGADLARSLGFAAEEIVDFALDAL